MAFFQRDFCRCVRRSGRFFEHATSYGAVLTSIAAAPAVFQPVPRIFAATFLRSAAVAVLLAPGLAVGGAASSVDLVDAIENYRMCILVSLSPDLMRSHDPAAATYVASQRCIRPRLVVAGQYALDHPGTREARVFVDAVTARLLNELTMWVENVQAGRVSPDPAVRRVR